MSTAARRHPNGRTGTDNWREVIQRAFAEFLALPFAIVAGFLLLAAGSYILDQGTIAQLKPVRAALEQYVFGNAQSTGSLLGTVATGAITVTSITFSLLLLAVQQSAGSMTNEVLDQFLRRRVNQVYFGFFVGLTLYALVLLAAVNPPQNPVYGATFALVLTACALGLLLLLLYTTIDQMRPSVIVDAIHDRTLAARARQQALLRATRRSPRRPGAARDLIRASEDGFVTAVDLVGLRRAAAAVPKEEAEIVLAVAIGSYVAFGDTLAEVRTATAAGLPDIDAAVQGAIRLERQRDLDHDPAYGIEQIETIGWTSISSSKHNPSPGLLAIRSLRDLLARWSDDASDDAVGDAASPVVYADNVPGRLFDALESLGVVASESMQHQSLAEVLRTLAVLFARLPPDFRRRAEEVVRCLLSTLGDQALTAELNAALSALAGALLTAGCCETAAAIRAAQRDLAATLGKLNSRSTRVPPSPPSPASSAGGSEGSR